MTGYKNKKWQDWDAQDVRDWMESHASLNMKEHAVKFQRQNIYGSYLYLVNDMTLKAELEIEDPKARQEILKAIKALSGSKKMLDSSFGRNSLLSSSEFLESQVGDIVAVDVADHEINGKVKFRGMVESISPDEVFGIGLGEHLGTCDGTWLGEQYFKCEAGHGIFVRAKDIKRIVQSYNVEDPSGYVSSEHAEMPDFDKFDSDFLDSGIDTLTISEELDLSGDFSNSRRKVSHRESIDLEEFEFRLKQRFGDPEVDSGVQTQDMNDLDRRREEYDRQQEEVQKQGKIEEGTKAWIEERKANMLERLMQKFTNLMKHFDANDDGYLSYQELSTWSIKANRTPIEEAAYKNLCEKFKLDPKKGMTPDVLLMLYEANGGIDQIHRDYASVFTKNLTIRVGRFYEMDDGRIGKARYIGNTLFANGEWVGLALFHPDGTNDGSMFGHRYFSARKKHGLFVRRHKIVRGVSQAEVESGVERPSQLNIELPGELIDELRDQGVIPNSQEDNLNKDFDEFEEESVSSGHRRQYTNSTVIRPDGKYNPAIYDVEVDHGILTPRLFYSLKVLYRNADIKLPRALGPKEMGKADYEVANYDLPFGERKATMDEETVERKLGPIDIGIAQGFNPADYELPDIPHWLDWRPMYQHVEPGEVDRKLGPLDIGRVTDYDVANYEWETDEDFLAERFIRYRRDLGRVSRKMGPVEIGRITDYDVANYKIDHSERSNIDWTKKADRKLGALDIGRNRDYDAAEYDWQTSNRSDIDWSKKAERKAGAVDTGRNNDYDAANYDWQTSDRGIEWSKKAERALGPTDIGRNKDYDAANYDWNLPDRSKIDWSKKAERQLGAVDIGRNRDYDAADYDWNKPEKGIDWTLTAERKLGAVEIGRNKDHSIPDYKWSELDDFLEERFDKARVISQEELDALRAENISAGPDHTKKPEGYVAPKYKNYEKGYDINEEKLMYNRNMLNRNAGETAERQLGPRDIGRINSKSWKRYKIEESEKTKEQNIRRKRQIDRKKDQSKPSTTLQRYKERRRRATERKTRGPTKGKKENILRKKRLTAKTPETPPPFRGVDVHIAAKRSLRRKEDSSLRDKLSDLM